VNRAENENDYDHDCDRDDDYDDEDDDEYDSIPLCRCGLRRQLSPRDENIDSAQNGSPSGSLAHNAAPSIIQMWSCNTVP